MKRTRSIDTIEKGETILISLHDEQGHVFAEQTVKAYTEPVNRINAIAWEIAKAIHVDRMPSAFPPPLEQIHTNMLIHELHQRGYQAPETHEQTIAREFLTAFRAIIPRTPNETHP
ncbi:MAG: hypothetical protein ACYDCE_16135 [Candidatus Acidiferrales bacterium]